MIDLSTFKVFDFSEGVPYVSITNNGLTFNRSAIVKMGYPANVQLLIDPEQKGLVVRRCMENDEKSVPFFKEKPNGVVSVRWNAKDLINTISRVGEWDLNAESYRVDGEYVPEQELMFFDLKKATRF